MPAPGDPLPFFVWPLRTTSTHFHITPHRHKSLHIIKIVHLYSILMIKYMWKNIFLVCFCSPVTLFVLFEQKNASFLVFLCSVYISSMHVPPVNTLLPISNFMQSVNPLLWNAPQLNANCLGKKYGSGIYHTSLMTWVQFSEST